MWRLVIATLVFGGGCSTYPTKVRESQSAFYSKDFQKSAELLEKGANEDGGDQLLYLFDRGMSLHLAGNYSESSKVWLKADKLSEVKDYVSLSGEVGSVILNENVKEYKGEDFEKVIINAFLAINYVMEGKFEDALVECRRVNHKLNLYKNEAKKPYEQNPFARYLSAIIYEATGKLDSAYIDYQKTYEIVPDYAYVQEDLLRLSKILGRVDDIKKWRKLFEKLPEPNLKDLGKTGELIVIYQQGKSAIKQPNPEWQRLPKFYHRGSLTDQIKVVVQGGASEFSRPIYNISQTAIKNLDDAYGELVAKGLAGVAAKYVIADQIRQRSEALGLLAWIGLLATDQADLRHWETLPESLQFVRMRLPPGDYNLDLLGFTEGETPTGENATQSIKIVRGKKTFINYRTFR